jgi:hypothetical protein
MKCARCQQENPPQAKFCFECGVPVSDSASTARSHAELKVEIEKLRTSLTEALEQQTATAEILHVISSLPIDVQPVFDMIAQNAVRICNARYCTVFR